VGENRDDAIALIVVIIPGRLHHHDSAHIRIKKGVLAGLLSRQNTQTYSILGLAFEK
jgi:hypothetical protein